MKARTILLAAILAVLLFGVCEYHRVTSEAERERARQAIGDCFVSHAELGIDAKQCVDMARAIDE